MRYRKQRLYGISELGDITMEKEYSKEQILQMIKEKQNKQFPSKEMTEEEAKQAIYKSAEDKGPIPEGLEYKPGDMDTKQMSNYQLMSNMYRLLKGEIAEGSIDPFNDLYWEMYDRFVKKERTESIGELITKRNNK